MRIPVSQIESVRHFLHLRIFPEAQINPVSLADDPAPCTLPVFASGVRAGFPSPADDHAEPGLDLNALIENRASTFCAWAEGDSMQDLGILDGDLMVIDRSLTAGVYLQMLRLREPSNRIEISASMLELKPNIILLMTAALKKLIIKP